MSYNLWHHPNDRFLNYVCDLRLASHCTFNMRGFEGTVTCRPRNSISRWGTRRWKLEAFTYSFLLSLVRAPCYRHLRACTISLYRLAPIKINKSILPNASAYWSISSRGANDGILLLPFFLFSVSTFASFFSYFFYLLSCEETRYNQALMSYIVQKLLIRWWSSNMCDLVVYKTS